MTLRNKLSTAIATSAVLLGTMAPGAFASTISISGNGAFSDNNVDFSSTNSTTVVQSNDTDIVNRVSVNNDTGGNSSSFNTGGDTTVRTGDATSDVRIVNEGNTNVASIPSCGCDSNTDVSIHGNGAFSDNSVAVDTSHDTRIVQENNQDIRNDVNVDNSTGNTGGSNWDTNSGRYPSWDNTRYSNDWVGNNYDHMKYMNTNNWWDNYMKNRLSSQFDRFGKNTMYFSRNFSPFFGSFGGNTGGDTRITTGDANSMVSISNSGNENILH